MGALAMVSHNSLSLALCLPSTNTVVQVSHELRNTTQGVHMTASTMLNEYATEAQLRDLAAICNAQLAHLRRALNGAFELGELVSQPRAAVAHKPVSIHLVVSDAVWGMTGTHLSLSLSLVCPQSHALP